MAYRNLELLTLKSHDESGNFLWQGVNGCQYTSACHSEGTPVFYIRSQDMAGKLSKCDSEYFLHCTCPSGPSHYGAEFETEANLFAGLADKAKQANEYKNKTLYRFDREMMNIVAACTQVEKYGHAEEKPIAAAILEKVPTKYRT
jgi:hypothetical protein